MIGESKMKRGNEEWNDRRREDSVGLRTSINHVDDISNDLKKRKEKK